jgi:hypothetical protein
MSSRAIRGPIRYDWYKIVTSGGYTVVNESIVIVNKTVGAATTITLPPSLASNPPQVREIIIADGKGDAATNNITVNPNGTDTINGLTTFVMTRNYGNLSLFDAGGGNWVTGYQAAPGSGVAPLSSEKATSINTVGAGTLTGAAMAGGTISRGGAQLGAAFTDTTDTPANLVAAVPNIQIGQAWELTVENTTNATQTITGATGVTVSGYSILPPNTWARYIITYSAASTFTMTGIASGPTVAATTVNSLANFRNMIDGGDFTTNPWQRGTSNGSNHITNTVTYGPDRFFFAGGASSSIDWSQVADTGIAGFNQSLKMQRTAANSNTAVLNMGQVLETADCIKCQGQVVTLSFWAKQGANYSGGALTVALNHSTTAGNDTAAHLVAASTNWQSPPTIINTTQALTTTWTRYQFTGTAVPATATQLGVLLTWTPTGTAGSDDSISIQGMQLEIGPVATPFEHRDVEVELALCQRYCYVINEPASTVIVGTGMISTTNHETIYIPFPTAMRAAPTVTVTAGSFTFNIAGTQTAVGGGFAGGGTHTPNAMSIVGTVSATVGQATQLVGGGGAGLITASADL